jgi:hypothetical protein
MSADERKVRFLPISFCFFRLCLDTEFSIILMRFGFLQYDVSWTFLDGLSSAKLYLSRRWRAYAQESMLQLYCVQV